MMIRRLWRILFRSWYLGFHDRARVGRDGVVAEKKIGLGGGQGGVFEIAEKGND